MEVEYKEYFNILNKSEWAPGEWEDEPDKVQFQDIDTGYACLIRRSDVSGALCGYVGLPQNNPAYGIHWDGSTFEDAQAYSKVLKEYKDKYRGTPVSSWPKPPSRPKPAKVAGFDEIRVHGGLNFSGKSFHPTVEIYKSFRRQIDYNRNQAAIYPDGSSFRWLREWLWCLGKYEDWANHFTEMSICLDVDDDLWWFGFDCSHSTDLCPALRLFLNENNLYMNDVYRNIAYVKQECAMLARQFKALTLRLPKP